MHVIYYWFLPPLFTHELTHGVSQRHKLTHVLQRQHTTPMLLQNKFLDFFHPLWLWLCLYVPCLHSWFIIFFRAITIYLFLRVCVHLIFTVFFYSFVSFGLTYVIGLKKNSSKFMGVINSPSIRVCIYFWMMRHNSNGWNKHTQDN